MRASTGVKEVENVNHDHLVLESVIKPENDTSDQLDCKEADDEIIFVENSVEVIEIDDDSDTEVIFYFVQTAENKSCFIMFVL